MGGLSKCAFSSLVLLNYLLWDAIDKKVNKLEYEDKHNMAIQQ